MISFWNERFPQILLLKLLFSFAPRVGQLSAAFRPWLKNQVIKLNQCKRTENPLTQLFWLILHMWAHFILEGKYDNIELFYLDTEIVALHFFFNLLRVETVKHSTALSGLHWPLLVLLRCFLQVWRKFLHNSSRPTIKWWPSTVFNSLGPNGESRAFQTGAHVTKGKKKLLKKSFKKKHWFPRKSNISPI